MADTFYLKNYAGTTTYDLLGGSLHLYHTGWTVQPAGPNRWTETYMLVGKTTDTNIIAATDTIDTIIHLCKKWQTNKKEHNSIWLEQHGDTENAKRALIYNISITPVPRGIINPLLGQGGAFYQLAVTRGNWEHTTATNLGTQSGVSAYAGSFTITSGLVGGSLPPRLSKVTLTGTAAGSGPLDKIWMGIKPTRDGVAGFDPRWEAEDAYYSQDVTLVNSSGAYPSGTNNSYRINFGTSSYQAKLWLKVEDIVGSNYDDMVGRYIALLRYQVTAADSIVYVGLMQGIGEFAHTAPIQWIEYTSGNWRYLPMGLVDIPGQSYRALGYGSNYVRNFSLVLYAGKSAGTGTTMLVDSILLVPFEHSFFTAGNSLTNTGTATTSIMYTHEDMEYTALSFDTSGQVNKVLQRHPNNWWLPLDGGKVVVVGEQSSLTDITDTVNVDVNWFQRYGTHREA